ncbi:hypothetical protein SAMD00019534_027270 [Acytostelium subglobosum LB1]|uniref:hypothetical protein n=1 Tax=Acytostelium subglobosum LB1 TaxID=1410327 RepID=UPI000644A1A7|nr:hypothetical protein SAMD00019534_027270 [Acytostelium subglobosum LB1]GAM19552.1 hypothetical protein SAMD00019534_027270 [Acytostelium subglobosum LB1]|eukprot:XP_012757479.1 hypothetical protein SAMD00019534_027270 [Acytostelium subglobosum LB1]
MDLEAYFNEETLFDLVDKFDDQVVQPIVNTKYDDSLNNANTPAPKFSRSGLVQYNKYLTNDELTTFLRTVAKLYPTLTKLYSIGKSVEGRDLWAMDLTTNAGFDDMKPQVKLVGNMHGDEIVGRHLLVYFIDYLTSNYKSNSKIEDLLSDIKISIIPSMNPDGYQKVQRGNAFNIDLNRDFPQGGARQTMKEQPETQAVMKWTKENRFVLSANLHGGAEVANYPYDSARGKSQYETGYYSVAPDDSTFRKIALTYSLNHKSMHGSEEFFAGITNGANWYVLDGGMQDWNYDNLNDFEITIEVSNDKQPNPEMLPSYWEDNRQALLSFVTLPTTMGVYGKVSNTNGQPLQAKIQILGINHHINSFAKFGDYYRLLDSGIFTMVVSSPGYKSHKQVIRVANGQRTKVDVVLEEGQDDVNNKVLVPKVDCESDIIDRPVDKTVVSIIHSKKDIFRYKKVVVSSFIIFMSNIGMGIGIYVYLTRRRNQALQRRNYSAVAGDS